MRLPAARARLAALGILIAGCLAAIARIPDLREHLAIFVCLFGVAFLAYLGAVWAIARCPAAAGRWLWLVLGFGLAFRLLLLPAAPTLSDDLYRYAWEGRVLAAGLSPYRYAPDAAALLPLRDTAIWPHVNNLDIPSPYPPVAQLGGLIGSALTPHSPLGVKLVATLADLLALGGLLALLAATGKPAGWALVYAWHPLVILEYSHSGHNDSLMLAPLLYGLALAARGARWRTGALFAVAVLAKVTPLLLLPLLARRTGLRPVVVAVLLIALAWAPLLALGGGAAGSIVTYLGQWADNDSVHAVLREVAGARGAKAGTLLLLMVGIGLVAAHPALRGRPLWWQAYVALSLSLVLASTVHAWYVTWLVPLLALQLRPSARWPLAADGAAWLLFSGLVVLPYLTYDTHTWRLWISFAEYLPLYALLGLAGVRRARLRLPGRAVLARWTAPPVEAFRPVGPE